MIEQRINGIPEKTAVLILNEYFKDCSLDTSEKSNAFGRIIVSQLIGDTSFVIIKGRFIGIQGYFNHVRGSKNPPIRNIGKKRKKMSNKIYNIEEDE
jgi:hypothetical protein